MDHTGIVATKGAHACILAATLYTPDMKEIQLVGILNMTPDSFSDGGLYRTPEAALAHAENLFMQGADIVDVGAESTNPIKSEQPLTNDAELERLFPVLDKLLPQYAGRISVDSYHPETIAGIADRFGASFIANDVTGMNNPHMREVVAAYGLPTFVSHLPFRFGTDIRAAHKDPGCDPDTVLEEQLERRRQLIALGLSADKIVLDPGIGFGKTPHESWQLLHYGRAVHEHFPKTKVMVGHSRKRFLAYDEHTGELPDRLPSNTAQSALEVRYSDKRNREAARIAIQHGANLLRVHSPMIYRGLTVA
jgi:dihydropteroate synthase